MKKKYIFNEWQPNIVLLILSMALFVWLIVSNPLKLALQICLFALLFGWSFSFSKKVKEVD